MGKKDREILVLLEGQRRGRDSDYRYSLRMLNIEPQVW